MEKIFLLLLLLPVLRAQTYEGDICSLPTGLGVCTAFTRCASASELVKAGKFPQICSFSGNNPIVCCTSSGGTGGGNTSPRPPQATKPPPARTTTEYVPTVAEYVYDTDQPQCPPIAKDMTANKTGRKAWDKCIEYQEIIYPCVSSATLSITSEVVRANYCGHTAVELVVGGVDTKEKEFPHMVMLGYGDDPQRVEWLCGGTLISDRFVVTAGHCTYSREFGDVTYVRTGALRRSQPVDSARTYPIAEIVKHPQYKPPGKYNDIALLKTQRKMLLDQFAVPACLDVGSGAADKALATGWGATQYKGANADVLQKVVLEKFTTAECRDKFPPGERNMREGFQQKTQLCYGDHELSRDTCQGDSGGPLQTYNSRVHCMYWLVGVTSFGKACGFAGNPGVYTRIDNFAPWIESVVWP